MAFLNDFKNKNILVAGLGKSGIAAVNLLLEKKYNVAGCDINKNIFENKGITELINKKVKIFTGEKFNKAVEKADLVILSPGIDQRDRVYKNKIVASELELAWSFISKPVIAVTGTNGKSTVTELTAEILEKSGKKVFKGGNLGTPLSKVVLTQDIYDVIVLEVSSFQLDTIVNFAPDIAVLLNATPDHLDRYENFSQYIASKMTIFKNQSKSQTAILNYAENHEIKSNAEPVFFNIFDEKKDSAIVENNHLKINFKASFFSINTKEFKLTGNHNLENLSASALTALYAGASEEGLKKAMASFKGLPHRMEFVDKIKNINFIDDSKATNPDSVYQALKGLDSNISLIMGGRDKGYDYKYLSEIVNKKVHCIILIGEAKEKIKKEINFKGKTFFENSMEKAVETAFKNLDQSGTVLLSPACSSFDMFKSYSHRGSCFRNAVEKLKRL